MYYFTRHFFLLFISFLSHFLPTGFLRHIKRDVAKSETFYLKAIEVNTENGDALGSYASFLHGVYNKTKEAEGMWMIIVVRSIHIVAMSIC